MAESLVKGFVYQGDIIADLRQEIELCQTRGHHAFLPGLKRMLRTELKALGISSKFVSARSKRARRAKASL